MTQQRTRRDPAIVAMSRVKKIEDRLVAYITSLPDESAPDGQKLAYMSGLLLVMARAQQDSLTALRAISLVAPPSGTLPNSILTPWVAGDPITIYKRDLRENGVLYSDLMVDCRNAKRWALRVQSSLDVAITVQVIGNFLSTFNQATDIGLPLPCAPSGVVSTGMHDGEWMPWIGTEILVPFSPTTGNLLIEMVLQE